MKRVTNGSGTASTRELVLMAVIGSGVVGLILGAFLAYTGSAPGFRAMGATLPILMLGIGAVALLGLAGLSFLVDRRAVSVWLAAFLGLVGGAIVGTVVGPVYRDPDDVRGVTGVMRLSLRAPPTSSEVTAECYSVAEGGTVRSVIAGRVVRLAGRSFALQVILDGPSTWIELYEAMDPEARSAPGEPALVYQSVDPADLDVTLGPDGRSGSIDFVQLGLVEGTAAVPPGFPAALRVLEGTLSWACEVPSD